MPSASALLLVSLSVTVSIWVGVGGTCTTSCGFCVSIFGIHVELMFVSVYPLCIVRHIEVCRWEVEKIREVDWRLSRRFVENIQPTGLCRESLNKWVDTFCDARFSLLDDCQIRRFPAVCELGFCFIDELSSLTQAFVCSWRDWRLFSVLEGIMIM